MLGIVLWAGSLAVGGVEQGMKLNNPQTAFFDSTNVALIYLRAGTSGLLLILLGSLLFNVHYVIASLPELLAVFVLCMAALYGLGMMTASVFLMFSREAWHWANLAQEPVYLASGFYFPIKNFPLLVSSLASLIPLTLGLDAMRQLVFASGPTLGFLSVPIEILAMIVLCVVFLVGAKLLLAHMERLAIREGRLTESRR
jgi:ABC-2 type transport system permease protein